MAAEESLSRLDSQVSMDASPPEINSVVQESGQTSVAGGKDVHAEIDTEVSKSNELEKYKHLMPSDIRIDFFDVMVLYSKDNKSEARTFCDHLKNDIKLKHNEPVKAVLYDECVPHAGSIFKLLETGLERCTHVFCYITKEFCEDKWTELSKDECLMEAIENAEKPWCVVPVITVPTKTAKFKIPVGLRALKGMNYYENDQHYRHKVSTLIQNNLHRRLGYERKQEEHQFTWIKKNKGTFHFGDEEIRCQENKKKLGTKQQKKEKTTEQGVNEGLIPSQPVFLQKAGLQDIGLLSLNPDVDGMHSKSDDQSPCTPMTPVNQSPCCWGTEVTVEEEEDQSLETMSTDESMSVVKKTKEKKEQHLETKSKDHSMLETKSNHSMSVKKTKKEKEHSLETNSKDHSRLETNSKDHSMPVKKTKEEEEQNLETISKDHSMSVKKTMEKKKQHLETKSKVHSMLETKSKDHSMSVKMTKEEEEQSLETKSKDHSMSVKKIKEGNEHYSSISEKGFASEMKKDQDNHFWHNTNRSNEKQVAKVTPRLKDRDGEKTDLDIVDRETNGDTGVKTIYETKETTSYEMDQTLPKTVDGDIRERSDTDLSRYVAMRPAAPLLAKASPIPPVTLFAVKSTCLVQCGPTSAQCTESSKGALSQDELD